MANTSQVPSPTPPPERKGSGIGATEDQVDMRDTVPQRIDSCGTKIEDLAGTGQHDDFGG